MKPLYLYLAALSVALVTPASAQLVETSQSMEGRSGFNNFLPYVGTTVSPALTLPAFEGEDPFTELDGTSVLHRSKTGIGYVFNARNLRPNSSYTNWFVAFNNPKGCFERCACGLDDLNNPAADVGVYYATGRVSDQYGQAVFSSETDYGELPAGDDQIPFDQLTTPVKRRAEVHIVARIHGPVAEDAAAREDQLTSFSKGCSPDGCVDEQVSVHRSPTCKVKKRRGRN